MAQNTPNRQLYDLLVSKNYDIQALDSRTGRGPVNEQGQPDINTADEFRFDFTTQTGRNYGSVVILFGDDNNLTMFFGDNVGRGMEAEDKKEWFDFLYQIKQFATKNFLDFQPENITKLKYTKQGQAAIKEGLFESWQGKGNISWNGQPTEARLVIKHKKALGEGEARFRFIESIYIETADRERFKMKSRSLTAAKAMLEHVRQGGNPYDARAQHINEIVEELSVLSRFRRANAGRILEGDTKNLVEQTDAYYQNMHSVLKHLGTSRGYQGYFESWTPADVNEGNLVVEDLKSLFVEQTIDHRIEEALPILARITQEANSMKEAKIFESWINNLVEGTWTLPETPEQKQALIDLMSKDFPVGPDATNATEQLYDLIGDDELFDRLEELADADANADARSVVMTRMQELSDLSPDVEAVLGQLQTTAPDTDLEAQPDQMAADVDGDEQLPQSVEEGVGNIGSQIKALYKKIYNAGDDAVEFAYYDSPIFAQYWDEYEGDLDSIIAEVDPSELQVILDELTSAAEDQGVAEGWTKLPSGDYQNSHTGVRTSKPPVKKKRGEKTGAEWDAIKAKKDQDLNEFAPPGSGDGGDDGFSEETLKRLAAQWYNGNEDPRVERTLMAAGWEIGQDEGYDNEPGVFVVQSGDVNGNSYLSWPAHELKQGVAEGQCNMSEAGAYCPEHGLAECGMYEYTGNPTNFGLEEGDELTRLKRLAHGK